MWHCVPAPLSGSDQAFTDRMACMSWYSYLDEVDIIDGEILSFSISSSPAQGVLQKTEGRRLMHLVLASGLEEKKGMDLTFS